MKGKELLLIAVSSFALTVIWIASNVYHAYATSTIDALLQIQILPISPNFDMATIEKLKNREVIQPATASLTQATPTPEISPTPATEEIIDIPTPTEGAVAAPSITEEVVVSDTLTPIESGLTP